MAIVVHGTGSPLYISQIKDGLGGSTPIRLSSYYKGGGITRNIPQNSAIPTSGNLNFSNFFNAFKPDPLQVYISMTRETYSEYGSYGNGYVEIWINGGSGGPYRSVYAGSTSNCGYGQRYLIHTGIDSSASGGGSNTWVADYYHNWHTLTFYDVGLGPAYAYNISISMGRNASHYSNSSKAQYGSTVITDAGWITLDNL